MKSLILISLTTCILNANGLESFLAKEDQNHKEQKENIKYFVIGKTNLLVKALKNDYMQFEISGEVRSNTALGMNQGLQMGNYMRSQANQYTNEENKDLLKSIKTDILEEIIIKNYPIDISFLKRGYKEKVIIFFDIDNKNNITNIRFIKPSMYYDINDAFKEAIIKSSQEIPTTNKKETKKLYYEFDI